MRAKDGEIIRKIDFKEDLKLKCEEHNNYCDPEDCRNLMVGFDVSPDNSFIAFSTRGGIIFKVSLDLSESYEATLDKIVDIK